MSVLAKKVFIHIPKCGGNSVEAKLRFNRIAFTRIEPDVTVEKMPDAALITGHISYDQFAGDEKSRFFSIMRSPLARALSHYYYNLKIKEEGPEYRKTKELGLEGFLMEHNNTMCRHMFGNRIFDKPATDEEKYDCCREVMRNRYLFIGKIAGLKHFDAWLLREFGCVHYKAHANRNEYDYDKIVPATVHARFMHRNMVDYMMYEYIGESWQNSELGNHHEG